MNKNDLKLIFLVLMIFLVLISCFKLFDGKETKKAIVYYENNVVLSIDLQIPEKKIYEVEGYNGKIIIIAEDGKVKVDSENSPLHLCSKQGYISKSYETIVCLPNKITIKIEDLNDLDVIVK